MGEPEQKVAMLAGASGLIGAHLLDALLDAPDFSRVYAVTRRPLGREHPRLANRIVSFDQRLDLQLKSLTSQVAFCSLGTTMRDAGSEQAFRRVDVDYVLEFARAARAAQAQRLIVVSSAGADMRSRHFYLRVKGEMEQALATLGFPAVHILQPGLLLGWRRSVWRPLELAGQLLMPLANPFLLGAREQFRAIPARTVAAAMVGAARSARLGTHRYTWSGIGALARSRPPRVGAAAEQRTRAGAK